MGADVSVVVPTHNRRRLLALTLRTVLWQRAVELEVVVVDDGSTDGTAAAVAAMDDARVRLVRNPTPQGVSAARNRGIAESATAWIAFCDDDDLWGPDKLSRQLRAAAEARRGWVYTGAVKVDAAQRIVGGKPPLSPAHMVERLPRENTMPGGCSSALVARAALDASGGFDPRFGTFADWDLWMRLARGEPPAWVPSPLVGYRLHAGSMSTDTARVMTELATFQREHRTKVDMGAFHHYLAWLHFRAGRRRQAWRHLAEAGARGRLGPATRDAAALVRAGLARRLLPHRGRRDRPHAQGAWRAEAEAWLARLRENESLA